MNKIQINFYDEIVKTVCPLNLETLKNVISRKFSLEKPDVEELLIYYFNDVDKITISNEEDYKKALLNMGKETENKKKFTLFIEVSEKSRLYMKEAEVSFPEEKPVDSEKEALRKEFEAKEEALKQLLEKEKIKRENEEKVRLEEEKKAKLEQEELQKSLEKIVLDAVNKKLENLKEDLIRETLKEATRKINANKKTEKSEQCKSPEKVVHTIFTCDGCGVGPIVGVRFHCTQCFNYDLCEECEKKDLHPQDHPLIKHKTKANFHHMPRFPHHPGPKFPNHHGPKFHHCKDLVEPFCRPFRNKFKFHHQIKTLRDTFDMTNFSDEQLIEALKKANGDIHQAVTFLF